jgi:hypothetical protein
MNSRILISAVAVAALSLLTACGGGDAPEDNVANRAAPSADTGGIGGSGVTTQSVSLGGGTTPAPAVGGIGGSGSPAPLVGGIGGSGIESVNLARGCGLESVDLTIAGARVNADGTAGPDSPGWIDVALAVPVRVDLMRLAAGQTLPLDFSSLPDGTYRQVRLLLVANDAAAPLADAVVATDRREIALDVSSAAQGGLPLAAAITVAQGQATASVLALDVCKAVSTTGTTVSLVSGASAQAATAY